MNFPTIEEFEAFLDKHDDDHRLNVTSTYCGALVLLLRSKGIVKPYVDDMFWRDESVLGGLDELPEWAKHYVDKVFDIATLRNESTLDVATIRDVLNDIFVEFNFDKLIHEVE